MGEKFKGPEEGPKKPDLTAEFLKQIEEDSNKGAPAQTEANDQRGGTVSEIIEKLLNKPELTEKEKAGLQEELESLRDQHEKMDEAEEQSKGKFHDNVVAQNARVRPQIEEMMDRIGKKLELFEFPGPHHEK